MEQQKKFVSKCSNNNNTSVIVKERENVFFAFHFGE